MNILDLNKYNVLAGLCDNGNGYRMAYKNEVIDNLFGLYYKVEEVNKYIEQLQLELVETREQNARMLKRVEELEERLKG